MTYYFSLAPKFNVKGHHFHDVNFTAILSVSDKTNLEKIAEGLSEAGLALVASGGTAKTLRSAGFEVCKQANKFIYLKKKSNDPTNNPPIEKNVIILRLRADTDIYLFILLFKKKCHDRKNI